MMQQQVTIIRQDIDYFWILFIINDSMLSI